MPRLALTALLLLGAAGCASLPPGANAPRRESAPLPPASGTHLGRNFESAAAANGGKTGFHLLSVGIDGLLTRIEMIDSAERTLDLQYYLFRGDQSGTLIAEALLRAADRGVQVRILVDDGETVAGDEKILSLSAHPAIQVRVFNPLRYRGHNKALRGIEFLFDKRRVDYRMHNKLLVVDNALALAGGRNIGDQYFQIDPGSQFGDDDIAVAGPMVGHLSAVYEQFWNSPLTIPAEAIDPKHTSAGILAGFRSDIAAANSPANVLRQQRIGTTRADIQKRVATGVPFAGIVSGDTPLIWANAQLVYDSPEKKRVGDGEKSGRLIYDAVAKRANAVSVELLMVTPYFIPSPDESAILKDLRSRKVQVSILTNSLQSTPDLAAHSGYMHYRRALLEQGIELHEIRALLGSTRGSGQTKAITRQGNYALHAKLFDFDRKSVFVGSMNFDQRSRRLNTEIGLIIDSPELAQQVASRFEALTELDNAYAVELQDQPLGSRPRMVWKTREAGALTEYHAEPARSEWQRIKVKFLSLLPIDDEL